MLQTTRQLSPRRPAALGMIFLYLTGLCVKKEVRVAYRELGCITRPVVRLNTGAHLEAGWNWGRYESHNGH